MTKRIRKAKTTPPMKTKLLHIWRQSPWLSALLVVALLSPLLANSKPLVCKLHDNWFFPAFYDYFGAEKLYNPTHPLHGIAQNQDWRSAAFTFKIWPPIGVSPTETDPKSINTPPFRTISHPLGTDDQGHDMAAGLIAGARVAYTLGLLALLAASLIGITLGLLSGYFGDRGLRLSRWHLYFTLPLIVLALLFVYTTQHHLLSSGQIGFWCFFAILSIVIMAFLGAFGKFFLPASSSLQLPVALPLDMLIQRTSEVTNSFPKLLILTVLVALLQSTPSIYFIALIAGLFSWPGIAAYVRTEMLRVRSSDYLAAAKLSGIPEWRILIYHALPNALPSAYVVMALFAANAILLEASLAFLGIRNDSDIVSWGSLMHHARLYPTCWWLALFPGILITVNIYALYQLAMRRANQHLV
jgi:peptide/nickel transport system permease protein